MHFIEKCRECGTVVNQCRCPGPKKETLTLCSNCAKKQSKLRPTVHIRSIDDNS